MNPLYWVFLICAVAGTTVVVFQFVLSFIGLGFDDVDIHDGDFSAPTDYHGGHSLGEGHAGAPHDGHAHPPHDSTGVFTALSLRAMVAGIAFFGIGGMAALTSDLPTAPVFLIAVLAGGVALAFVQFLLVTLARLRNDGTARIEHAVGQVGAVYLSIPAARSGAGKIHINVNGRLLEYRAVTADKAGLPTGAKVVVTAVAAPQTLEVAPIEVNKPVSA
jgi:hypothetical protein